MKKQSLFMGTMILGLSGVLIRFLGIFFRFPLIILMGDEGIGYYQMAYPLYMFYVSVLSGVPIAMSKLISERLAENDFKSAVSIKNSSMRVVSITGFTFTIIILLLSKSIVNAFGWGDKSYYSVLGIALAPAIISIMSVYRGFFQGCQNVVPTSISQAIEQLCRVIFGVSLAFFLFKFGIEYAAGGAALGTSLGALGGTIYLFFRYRREFGRVKAEKFNKNIVKSLLKLALPISLGATVTSIMGLVDSFLVPKQLMQAGLKRTDVVTLFGQYTGKASVIVNIPLTISMALCISLVPIIAQNYHSGKMYLVKNKIDDAIKFAMALALPCTMGIFFLSNCVIYILFPGNSQGGDILRCMSLCLPFIILTQVITAILQSVGVLYIPVLNLSIGILVKIILTIYLVPNIRFNIYGAVIASIFGYATAFILNLYTLNKKIGYSIDFFRSIAKPLFSSCIMIIFVVFGYNYIYNIYESIYLATLISVVLGVIIYMILVLMLGVVKYDNIKTKLLKNQR